MLLFVWMIALLFSLLSYTELFVSTIISVSSLQPLKAELPMEVMELGMVIEVRLLQPRKASSVK